VKRQEAWKKWLQWVLGSGERLTACFKHGRSSLFGKGKITLGTLQVHSSGASINQTSSLIVGLAESGVVLENKKRKMTIRPEDNLQEAHRSPAPAPAAAVAAAIHDSKTHLIQITPRYFLV